MSTPTANQIRQTTRRKRGQREFNQMDRSARQMAMLHYIQGYISTQGMSPALHEIALTIGLSKSVTFQEINTLLDRGLVRRWPKRARTLTLTALGKTAINLGRLP